MTNPNRDHNIDKLVEALQTYGIKTKRIKCNQVVCSFPDGNYMLEMSPTEIPLEADQQMERCVCDRVDQHKVQEPDVWKKAAGAALLAAFRASGL